MRRRQRFEIEEQRRAVQLVEDRVHERGHETAQLLVGRRRARLDPLEQLRQAIERVLVAGKENLFFVLEVVVEVPFLHVKRGGDLLDGGAVIAELPKGLRRALQDVDARVSLGVGVAGTPALRSAPGGRPVTRLGG